MAHYSTFHITNGMAKFQWGQFTFATIFKYRCDFLPLGVSQKQLDAGMWRYHANRMDARRSQFDVGRVVAYI